MNKIFLYIFIAFCIVIVASFATYYFIVSSINKNRSNVNDGNQTFCTMEAKLCPDGSYVGREGPNCEFTECPTE